MYPVNCLNFRKLHLYVVTILWPPLRLERKARRATAILILTRRRRFCWFHRFRGISLQTSRSSEWRAACSRKRCWISKPCLSEPTRAPGRRSNDVDDATCNRKTDSREWTRRQVIPAWATYLEGFVFRRLLLILLKGALLFRNKKFHSCLGLWPPAVNDAYSSTWRPYLERNFPAISSNLWIAELASAARKLRPQTRTIVKFVINRSAPLRVFDAKLLDFNT